MVVVKHFFPNRGSEHYGNTEYSSSQTEALQLETMCFNYVALMSPVRVTNTR